MIHIQQIIINNQTFENIRFRRLLLINRLMSFLCLDHFKGVLETQINCYSVISRSVIVSR